MLTKDNDGIKLDNGIPFGQWFGKTEYNNEVSAGIYFYYVTNADETQGYLGKICIIK